MQKKSVNGINEVFPSEQYTHKIDDKNLLKNEPRCVIFSLETGETCPIIEENPDTSKTAEAKTIV